MGKPCIYCGQSDTRKDVFGYCKKYNCYEVSGVKRKVDAIDRQLLMTSITESTYKCNMFDGTPYNPRKDKLRHLLQEKTALITSNGTSTWTRDHSVVLYDLNDTRYLIK
jgi:hypothetical protein